MAIVRRDKWVLRISSVGTIVSFFYINGIMIWLKVNDLGKFKIG